MKDIIDKKVEYIVNWLREQVKNTKTNGLLVGVSGGIDSALVAYLIKAACPNNSMGVILPINSSEDDVKDAKIVVKECGISSITIDLTEQHNMILKKVIKELKEKNKFDDDNLRNMDANLRARLRMSTLYAIANNLNYLVVGTDNASEIYTGYFTKHGDGAADILPIGSLKKYEVYEWAKHLDISRRVIEKVPSAGLWEGQTDEEEMGVSYKSIDDYLDGKPIDEKDEKIIKNLYEISKHKRERPPIPNINI